MVVEEGLDTGAIYRRAEVAIGPDETLPELRTRLVEIGSELLVGELESGLGEPVPPEEYALYAAKVEHPPPPIDWAPPAGAIHQLARIRRSLHHHPRRPPQKSLNPG